MSSLIEARWERRVPNPTPMMVALGILAALLIASMLLLEPGGFYVGDQGVKFLQIDALKRTGTLAVGRIGDPASIFNPTFTPVFHLYVPVDDEYRIIYPPFYALATLPFYALFGMRGLVILSVLGVVIAAYSSARIAALLKVKHPHMLILIVGLATPFLFYANVLWEHSLAVGLLGLALYLCLVKTMFLAGLLLGVAGVLRPEAFLFAVVLIGAYLASFRDKNGVKSGALLLCGMLLASAPFFAYNRATYGAITGAHVAMNTINQPIASSDDGLGLLRHSVEQAKEYLEPMGLKKWLAAIAIIAGVAVWLRVRGRGLLPALWLSYLAVVAIGLIHLAQGVVGASLTDAFPFSFAALAGIPLIRRDVLLRFLWVLTCVYVAVALPLVPQGPWHAGGWGPRYLLALYPVLAVLAWVGFERSSGRLARFSLAALLAFSVAVQGMGLWKLHTSQATWSELNAELTALAPNVIATGVWWLPQIAAPIIHDIRLFGIVDEKDLQHVASTSDRFWWVWTSDPSIWWEYSYLRGRDRLPPGSYTPLAVKQLSTRYLEAVLYEVDREQLQGRATGSR